MEGLGTRQMYGGSGNETCTEGLGTRLMYT